MTDAHLTVLDGATTQLFQQMWLGTRGAASGLQDRFTLFVSDNQSVSEPQTPSSAAVSGIVERLARQVTESWELDESAQFAQQRQEWWAHWRKEIGAGQRIPALISRALLLLAITNDRRTVDSEILGQALAFGEQQIRLRQQLMPPDAYGWVQAFENLTIKMFTKHGSGGLTLNQTRRYVNPEKHPGGYGPFIQAWTNLVRAGRLRMSDTNRKKSEIFVLAE